MIDTWQEIYGDLMRNKLRTIATGFAVTSGLFLLIVLLGAGNGLIHSFTHNMGDMTFDVINVYGGRTNIPYEGIKEGRYIQLDGRDVTMTQRTFRQNVTDVMPVIEKGGLTATNGQDFESGVSLQGIYPAYEESQSLKIIDGRFINETDLTERRKVAVIGTKSAQSLFKNGQSAVGSNLNISGIIFRVIGVYKSDDMFSSKDYYVPYSTISAIYNRGKKIDQMTMRIKDIPTEAAMDTFERNYVRATSYIHSFSPEDRNALWIWNQAADNIRMNKAMNYIRLSFWILGILTLISGIVGVSNIMLISVKERTHEFGVRRAIGARPWSIIRMVMLESVVITAIFGYIGMVLGVYFCEWMDKTAGNQVIDIGFATQRVFIDPTVDITICIQATLVIIIAGAFAGFFPAWKTVKIKPIDALRG